MLGRKSASKLWDDDELCTKKITVDTERVNELRCPRMELCGLMCKKVSQCLISIIIMMMIMIMMMIIIIIIIIIIIFIFLQFVRYDLVVWRRA